MVKKLMLGNYCEGCTETANDETAESLGLNPRTGRYEEVKEEED